MELKLVLNNIKQERPTICRKRGCYIQPKSLFPKWNELMIRCDKCPYDQPKKGAQ